MIERLTPLPDISSQSKRLRMDLRLPSWVETGAIGVNVPMVHRLMDMGGISHVRMAAAYPQVLKEGVQVPEYSVKGSENHRHTFSHNVDWCHIEILLDTASENLQEKDSWAPHIDTALRGGIRQAGTDHLLHYYGKEQILYTLGVNTLIPAMEAVTNKGNTEKFILEWGAMLLLIHFLGVVQNGYGKNGAGYRLSVLPGVEVSRVFLLQLLARTAPLVTAMK